jgi:hypothetical protein
METEQNRSANSKPVVTAIPVPWSVSTSVANLSVSWEESGQCVVFADAFFGQHHAESPYKRIGLIFQGCISVVVQVLRDDSEVIGGDRYDWNHVIRPLIKSSAELTAWLKKYADDWLQTGICPNPQLYRVDGSAWASSFRDNYQHFIIKGNESYVELLANKFEYKIEKDISE